MPQISRSAVSLFLAALILYWPSLASAADSVVNTEEFAAFGASVAMEGDYAVVGTSLEDSAGTNAGAVYVYRDTGTEWVIDARIVPADPSAGQGFGGAVAIDGDSIIVGAASDNEQGSTSGSAYIFVRGVNGWTQQAKLLASDGVARDTFGVSVAISGDVAVVGANMWEDASSGADAGAAYVFRRNGTS